MSTKLKVELERRVLPGWPHSEPDEIEAAVRVLESGKINYWTGDEGRQFEKEFAEAVGCKYAVALANGTVALELALLAAFSEYKTPEAYRGSTRMNAD